MAKGDIGATIDTLQLYGAGIYYPSGCHVAGDVYVAALDPATGPQLCTFSVDYAGEISDTIIETGQAHNVQSYRPRILKIGPGVYAIVYYTIAHKGWVRTIGINDAGAFTSYSIDSLEFDPVNCVHPEIIHVTGTIYAIAYQGPGDDGYLCTVQIQANGNIGAAVIDSWEFNTANTGSCDIFRVSDNIFAIVHIDDVSDGWVKTVQIDDAGTITTAIIASWEFEGSDCIQPELTRINGNTFCVAYAALDTTGWMCTFKIYADGTMDGVNLDKVQFDNQQGQWPSIRAHGDEMVLILARCLSNHMKARTFTVTGAGDIVTPRLDVQELVATEVASPYLINVTGNLWLAIHKGVSLPSVISFTAEGVFAGHEMTMGIGP